MPLQVDRRQKQYITFLYSQRGMGLSEIQSELERKYEKDKVASRATIIRELRKFRLGRESEYGREYEEGKLVGIGEEVDFKPESDKRKRRAKLIPWTLGQYAFNDEDAAIISQILTEAIAYDITIPRRTSIVLARWVARIKKAYPKLPAIIIWYAAYQAEFIEFLEFKLGVKADYRHIDRFLQFAPWKGDTEEEQYEEVCKNENIGFDMHWWRSHMDVFQETEKRSTTHISE